eukprot:6214246-Pleurochrysis_carterae.AAC.5
MHHLAVRTHVFATDCGLPLTERNYQDSAPCKNGKYIKVSNLHLQTCVSHHMPSKTSMNKRLPPCSLCSTHSAMYRGTRGRMDKKNAKRQSCNIASRGGKLDKFEGTCPQICFQARFQYGLAQIYLWLSENLQPLREKRP